jgi:RimJ/RimL family protein N-acetyltransferase
MHWAELWPPFGLTLRCGPLELRPVRFDDIPQLLDLVGSGIIADDVPAYPLAFPFADGEYTLAKRRESVQFWWRNWAAVSPSRWSIQFTVLREGVIVGVQDIIAHDFPTVRSAETGSWLGVAHQGRGTGTLMRQAIAMFAFDHLGARDLRSGAFHDNARSLAVSRKVGYRENGRRLLTRGTGEVDEEILVRLMPEDLIRPEHELIVDGVAPFLELLGLSA